MPTQLAHGLQVMSMCKAFSLSNLEVDLIVPNRVNFIKEDTFLYYGIEKVFSIKKILCLDLIWWNNRNIFFWIQTLSFLFFTKIFLYFEEYDYLYTREQTVGFFFKNYVLEIHSLPKKTRKIHLRIWKKARALVVLTPFIKQTLVDLGISEEKILVSPDGVDLKMFDIDLSKTDARDKLNLSQDKNLIGYVGMLRTLGMEKGIDTAISALKELSSKNTQLVLVGGSKDDINFYKQMAKVANIEDKVIFVGRVSHLEVPFYLKAFDVLVAPFPENQHYSYYMSPMKIFEYMASKRPIIATKLPSLESILGNGRGILITPGNSIELAKAVDEVLKSDGEVYAQRAFNAVSEYTWEKRANNILKFIK